ncbi:protein PSK SIMULATOR 1-like [Typha angustifolia]|uniref:protein PSK SIMULATOR 1-like n=1 Tax=Typha angustifolia TaxID=59011 RepID=UPI003C2FA67D
MVAPKHWLSGFRARFVSGSDPTRSDCLGILAFEAAATMARLISLHRSLSDSELRRLRSDTMRSEGIAYLVSADQSHLLRLACAELVGDLDRAASAVARLGLRCSAAIPRGFERFYADAKAGGLADLDRVGLAKNYDKRVKKMERYVPVTAKLYSEMDTLNELEQSERKMEQWKRFSGPIPLQQPDPAIPLRRELKTQRQRVRRLMEESLWSETFDKAVGLMVNSVLAILLRICSVFAQFVPGLPSLTSRYRHYSPRTMHSSGPLERPFAMAADIRFSAPLSRPKDAILKPNSDLSKLLQPSPTSVGGSGMALRYANVIVAAEKVLALGSEAVESDDGEAATREEMYEMLPIRVRAAVKAKLREWWRKEAAPKADEGMVAGWKEAVERIVRWLGPVARDTVRWHEERNMDRQQRFDMKARALMLQTLQFADREKTEAAVVEVLVGLSCMCWYHEQRRGS